MVRTVIFVLGQRGSGKTTLCQKLSDYFGFAHINVNEIITKNALAKDSKYGKCLKDCLQRGEDPPCEIVVELLHDSICTCEKTRILLDGFPKTVNAAQCFEQRLKGKVEGLLALYLDCPEIVCIARTFKLPQNWYGFTERRVESEKKNTRDVLQHYERQGILIFLEAKENIQQVYEESKTLIQKNPLMDDFFTFRVL